MLNGKTAIITGGSRGIGKAIALEFARQGANVAILYRGNSEKAEETCQEAEKLGASAICIQCDVAVLKECENAASLTAETFGSIDILVNNAGITRDMLIIQMEEADFEAVIDTNLKGAFNMIKSCYRTFMKKRSGKIINVTSVSGIMGNAGQANYSASKAGLIGLTKTVAKELAGRNVCCNAIAPGFVETEMTEQFMENERLINEIPLKRMAKPEEIAHLAAFLADDMSSYITGEVIRIDGGLAM
ncbi:MAG: 3-oxoacyl-[acyl-carrier-protein] reductase [Bacillota bacterium]|nr:3-oxoacyl-[acyl-carrier-protein] reductase [Bacillota bacterium]